MTVGFEKSPLIDDGKNLSTGRLVICACSEYPNRVLTALHILDLISRILLLRPVLNLLCSGLSGSKCLKLRVSLCDHRANIVAAIATHAKATYGERRSPIVV